MYKFEKMYREVYAEISNDPELGGLSDNIIRQNPIGRKLDIEMDKNKVLVQCAQAMALSSMLPEKFTFKCRADNREYLTLEEWDTQIKGVSTSPWILLKDIDARLSTYDFGVSTEFSTADWKVVAFFHTSPINPNVVKCSADALATCEA